MLSDLTEEAGTALLGTAGLGDTALGSEQAGPGGSRQSSASLRPSGPPARARSRPGQRPPREAGGGVAVQVCHSTRGATEEVGQSMSHRRGD